MTFEHLQAFILGIVQGLTEFLPVSSTAHLIMFPWFFGWSGIVDSLTFDIALHAGTLLSLLYVFWKDWLDILLYNRKMLLLIILANIPAGTAGIFFKDLIETTFRSEYIIVITLIAFGVLMLIAEQYSKSHADNNKKLTPKDALVIGCAQAIALIPGVSRSGITITAGLFRSLSREAAARFSFLLSTPVIFGATVLETRKLIKSVDIVQIDLFVIGFITAFISGLIAINFLLKFFKKYTLSAFAYYRFLLAAVILIAIFCKQ